MITSIVAAVSLPTPTWEGVSAFLQNANAEKLIALIDALDTAHGDAVENLRGQALEALALQPDSLTELVARVPADWFTPRPRHHPDYAARKLAARLGSTQSTAAISAALWLTDRGGSWRTVLALWIQEAVIRGADLSNDPHIVALWADLDHPLTALPLSPHPLERLAGKNPQRFFPTGGSGWGSSVGWHLPDIPRLPAGDPPPILARQRMSPALRKQIGAAFSSACAVSNGRSDAAIFRLTRPVEHLSRSLLMAMTMTCFGSYNGDDGPRPTTPGDDLEAMSITAEQALAVLIGEAANGGCYNLGWSGAWGRHDGWRTLGGLCGAEADASVEAIAALAASSQWATFRSAATWFDHIMADPTLVCLRPDRQTMAVFAGTDSD